MVLFQLNVLIFLVIVILFLIFHLYFKVLLDFGSVFLRLIFLEIEDLIVMISLQIFRGVACVPGCVPVFVILLVSIFDHRAL